MAYLIDTTNVDIQIQNFELYGRNLQFTLKYNEVGRYFAFDLIDTKTNEILAINEGLAVNAPSLQSSNLGFIVTLLDTKYRGENAVCKDDIVTRLQIIFMTHQEYVEFIK